MRASAIIALALSLSVSARPQLARRVTQQDIQNGKDATALK
jgi:hypothetical protein